MRRKKKRGQGKLKGKSKGKRLGTERGGKLKFARSTAKLRSLAPQASRVRPVSALGQVPWCRGMMSTR